MEKGFAQAALTAVLVTSALIAPAAPAGAAPTEPLGHAGRWITDASGKVMIVHGVSYVPLAFGRQATLADTPEAVGFGADDADFLAANGFNAVRLGFAWDAAEPRPGVYDESYLGSYERTQRLIASRGIYTLLDPHQDQFSPSMPGRGFPDWAAITDGFPNLKINYPLGYLLDPAQLRVWDNFWANAPGPGGVGIQDRFLSMWNHVAGRFAGLPAMLGYETMNEPWPGLGYPLCVNIIGCLPGGFDQTALTDFSRRTVAAIRAADPSRTVYAEPNLLFDFGAATQLGDLGDPNTGFSFHDYCLGAIPGLPAIPDPIGICEVNEQIVLENAEAHSRRSGAALILTEFADSPDSAIHRRLMRLTDRQMTSWTSWAWSFANGSILPDPSKPPTPENLRGALLDELVRPYPQLVAGTPTSYRFDPATRVFDLAYTTARADGGGRFETAGDPLPASSPQSEVFVPERHYPAGYDVDVEGAAIASAPGAQTLRLVACPGVTDVSARISPPGAGAGDGPDCTVAPPPAPGAAAAQTPATVAPARKRAKRCRKRTRRAKSRKRRCAKRKHRKRP